LRQSVWSPLNLFCGDWFLNVFEDGKNRKKGFFNFVCAISTMPIYTRYGDKGETVTLGGKTVSKDHERVVAYGEVDELNALLGVCVSFMDSGKTKEYLGKIQKDLFVIGAELAATGKKKPMMSIRLQQVEDLEQEIDSTESSLSPLNNFILPGGSKTASMLHLARTVCRRSERSVVSLSRKEKINPQIITYLNRLSDLLFVLARATNRKKRVEEVIWRGR
jgi:cob(I)alamin adenosyltransferase